jgi:hypothetical protein
MPCWNSRTVRSLPPYLTFPLLNSSSNSQEEILAGEQTHNQVRFFNLIFSSRSQRFAPLSTAIFSTIRLNSTLSVRIEELNAQISSLYVENLRLRASEIALTAQLKKEREKSRRVMADAEMAVRFSLPSPFFSCSLSFMVSPWQKTHRPQV